LFVELSDNTEKSILEFASLIVRELREEIIGIDMGFDGKRYHIYEFQVDVFIGPYTLQASNYWYFFDEENKKWNKIYGESELEYEYCMAVNITIERYLKN